MSALYSTPMCGHCIRWRRLQRRRNVNHFGRCMHPLARRLGVWWTRLTYKLVDGTLFAPEASPLLHETHGQGCAGFKAHKVHTHISTMRKGTWG